MSNSNIIPTTPQAQELAAAAKKIENAKSQADLKKATWKKADLTSSKDAMKKYEKKVMDAVKTKTKEMTTAVDEKVWTKIPAIRLHVVFQRILEDSEDCIQVIFSQRKS
jgi:hypothetical protein